ncbi:phosphoribosyltransferase [Micromonospora fluostatini]|uniref:adenine phosphoribosyltransferase n=1 Tax=Micromonospora fluostatini TaxID=1629071 RepID=A0ABY2DKB5_9ACTN|nr:phosphoribosyltransferase [Micromonospora fluostatini]
MTGGQIVAASGVSTVAPAGAAATTVVGVAAHDAANGARVTVWPLTNVEQPTVVVAPAVTGLLLGPLAATALGVGFVPALKPGDGRRPPGAVTWAQSPPDFRGRRVTLGIRDRHLGPGDRVLVVDDWVATGAQVRAIDEVCAARGATVVGVAAVAADCPPEVARELRIRALVDATRLT